MKKLILTITSVFAISLILSPKAQAACSFAASGNVTISASCGIDASTINGPDTGTSTTNTAILTASSGTITIGTNATLATGSICLTGGNIAFASGAQIKLDTAIWAPDSDADGYASSFTFYITSATGRVRRNTLSSITEVDCNDAAFEFNNCCLAPEYC